jgi:hypothetical protein
LQGVVILAVVGTAMLADRLSGGVGHLGDDGRAAPLGPVDPGDGAGADHGEDRAAVDARELVPGDPG